jgi:hypothetical protein
MKTPNKYLSTDELLKTEALAKLAVVSSSINEMLQETLMGIPAALVASGAKGSDDDVLSVVGKRIVALANLKAQTDKAVEAVNFMRTHAKPGPKGGRRRKAAAPVAAPVAAVAPEPAPVASAPAPKRKYKKRTKSALPAAPPGPKPAGYTGKGTRGGWRPNSGRPGATLKELREQLRQAEAEVRAEARAEARASKKN